MGDSNLLHEPLLNANDIEVPKEINIEVPKEIDVTPYASASIFSIISFSWIGSLISLGKTKILDLDDVPQLPEPDTAKGTFETFETNLEKFRRANNNRVTTLVLAKALLLTVWKETLISGVFFLLYTLSTFVGPLLIDVFVQYLNGQQEFANEGFILGFAFFGAKVVESLANRQYSFRVQQVGFRARAALVEKTYRKGLTLSSQSTEEYTSGRIINIMAVDAEGVGEIGWYIHDLWMVGPQIFLALLILYKNLGLASAATLASTILVMLVNLPLGKFQDKFQEGLMKSKDKRMKEMSEILRNMKILKLYAWETKFFDRIKNHRNDEAGWLKKILYTKAVANFVFWGAPAFVSAATFSACLLTGIPLTTGKILSALATFRILQEPINNLPGLISVFVQTNVSMGRIASFLSLDDLPSDVVEKLPRGSTNLSIVIVDGNFSWDTVTSSNLSLCNINVSISQGMKVAICGSVGAGKSSLLSCILGEMPKLSGRVTLCGTKAYVAQSPWIQSGTIQENILFGKVMEIEKYDHVLEACALKDLEILPFGDKTIIGERGINLSGGQKQRMQIARALYQEADIYLLDDPFSAVDAHTGTHLFNECIRGLLSVKTVVYVTHQVKFLEEADLVLVMKNGKITQAGRYENILIPGSDFMELVGAHEEAIVKLDPPESIASIINCENGTRAGREVVTGETEDDQNWKTDGNDDIVPKAQLVDEEEREKGKVEFSVYWKYLTTAYGGALVPFILLAQIFFQLLQIGSNYWMSWATPVSEEVAPPVRRSTLIIVYVSLSVASSFCVLFRSTLLATAGYKTATLLFNKMHSSIFRAPMSFLDATPSGRIFSRASADQSAMDLTLPDLAGQVAFSIIQLLGIIAVMSQVAWEIIIIFIPILVICICIQQYFIPSARELSRLIGVYRVPIIQHFSETIAGSSTIRSFDQEVRFQDASMKLIDSYSRPKFHRAAAMEWFSFRLDFLSLVTFTSLIAFLVCIPKGKIDPAVAGLAVTYALNLSMLCDLAIWRVIHLENKIISAERILQYINIPCEPLLVVESNRPDSRWPSQGEVNICNLKVRYAPHMPLVLRGLNYTFSGGKRTGIVGRTGCGKSTLALTLFRIVDPVGGLIKIDGIDICSIGLHDLRSRLSIIPQDPAMFEGTVRTNLDPLEEHTDVEIWEALDKCQLGDEVRKREKKLDSAVSESGENWSVGQRQLVCLGRVLLRKSKVLVLDEATASIDAATDNLINQTLRLHFTGSTAITIAHRIPSVIDCDEVLLLDNGLEKEYGSPKELLQNTSSSFFKLVEASKTG